MNGQWKVQQVQMSLKELVKFMTSLEMRWIYVYCRRIRRLIEILDKLNHSMLIATHDLEMARSLCSRVIVLKEGKVFADGLVEELVNNPVLIEECGL